MDEHERYLFDLRGFLAIENALSPEQVADLNRLADETHAGEADPGLRTNGGFGCIPGSHKSNYPAPKDWLDLKNPAPCAVAVPGKAGSAIIFTEALTHGTLPWRGAGERRTLFLKDCPKHMAWSREYPAEAGQEGLTEDERRVLRRPGMWPE